MVRQIARDEVKSTAKDLLEDTHLPFSDLVMAFPMLDKFKMPCVDEYNGSGDPTEHIENFRAHLILHDANLFARKKRIDCSVIEHIWPAIERTCV